MSDANILEGWTFDPERYQLAGDIADVTLGDIQWVNHFPIRTAAILLATENPGNNTSDMRRLLTDAPRLLALCVRQEAEIERLRVIVSDASTCLMNAGNRDDSVRVLRAALERIIDESYESWNSPILRRLARAALKGGKP